MGIYKLLVYLRKLCPDIVQECTTKNMSGCKIAFDLAILCYQKKSDAVRRQVKSLTDPIYDSPDYEYCLNYMITSILQTIRIILYGGCTPVMVFDGTAPDLKRGTKAARIGKSNTKKNNIANLRRIAKGLIDEEGFTMSSSDISFLQGFQKRFQKKHKRPIQTIDDIRYLIKNELNQFVVITARDYVLLGQIFAILRVPHIYAESEAEQTCAQMCKMKDVTAIFTTDSDCLVYGCPIMINYIKYTPGARVKTYATLRCYSFKNVLKVTGLRHQQFIDFCILCGTDFNDWVSGYGTEKHHYFILKYGSIEKIRAARKLLDGKSMMDMTEEEKVLVDYDTNVIDYYAVRKFFCTPISYDKSRLSIKINKNHFPTVMNDICKIVGDESFLMMVGVCKQITEELCRVSQIAK